MYFWAPASVILTFTYAEYVRKKDPQNLIKSLPFKFYAGTFAAFFMVATLYSFG